ncbi:IclR family transcriptional regulator [Clostridium tyrobutyricum]|uniref:IclR family transcriptional regulator n=1 Tax=Clostridium tyrobutyricum TaxID=1519 RepID=UPI00030F0816|nr:IclR family transcriptional regulator [Clostridium tyrobutyricum]MEA5008723.1 IclR family transcriptional regulator [Clostridium tyrobutyricum]
MKLHNPTLRVLRILELVESENGEGKNLSEISKILDIPKGTLSPILKTLAETNYIHFNNDAGCYSIGFRAFELGLSYGSSMDILSMIQERMKEIIINVREICQLGILSGLDVFYLLKENPDNAISIRSNVGSKLPAYATGIGKALLSGKTEQELFNLYNNYKYYPFTKNTITNTTQLIDEVSQVKKTGIAHENEESNDEICCLAVPLSIDGEVKASISVTIPKFRFTKDKQQAITHELLQQKKIIEDICRIQQYHFDF